MSYPCSLIRDCVEVRRHPTVVRLSDLESESSHWLGETFVLTKEVQAHLAALQHCLRQPHGSGVFLIGHYGSGKSHLLAYLALQLRGQWVPEPPHVVPISLVNFGSTNRLEDIVAGALGVAVGGGDRRPAWEAILAQHARGLVLLFDELSEFLRAKPDARGLSEDVRFLQFLGEYAQDHRLWIVAAMQEEIEHTGALDFELYRKIKDRYPLRLLLTPAHVQALVADSILIKKPVYAGAVQELCRDLKPLASETSMDFETLQRVYPLHPATLNMLEEIRDRFSQARGVIDFTVTRLLGDPARGVDAFLDQPFGSLLTPDTIVDHFQDLFEVQPEFLPLAQQLLPWYANHLDELFDRPALRDLARRILKLLLLVHLSPAREALRPNEALGWLMLMATRLEPSRNRAVIERVLTTLADRGRYVVRQGDGYRLDLRDDSAATLERLLAREVAALEGQGTLVLERLVPLLPATAFNPFHGTRNRWQHRRVTWYFHERRFALWVGDENPEVPRDQLGICLRLPWGNRDPAPGCFTVLPAAMEVTPALVELAALQYLREQPASPELARRVAQRLDSRRTLWEQAVRTAWQSAQLLTPDAASEPAPRLDPQSGFEAWLDQVALTALRRTYPAFERFAPQHGPLPKEAWLRFLRFAVKEDLGSPLADEYVRLIREAYLVPMGLLRRKGQEYTTPANLDRHELVTLLAPLLQREANPRSVHEHLSAPIYGLVPDQINLLLVFLLLQGEIDILKDRRSYRETFELLPNPLQYDRIVAGTALSSEALRDLEHLCRGLGLAVPSQWSALTQRRTAHQLKELGRRETEHQLPLLRQLVDSEHTALAKRLQAHIDMWASLEAGKDALHGLQQFLFNIGTASAFLADREALRELPERIPRLLAQAQRLTHVLQHPIVRRLQPVDSQALGASPGLDDLPGFERWLQRADRLYEAHKASYRERHEAWWNSVPKSEPWQCPPLARSRHLDLSELATQEESCLREAEQARCSGLVDLNFQAQCRCGFDGETAPVAGILERLAALRQQIEERLRLFFAQGQVKARIRQWQQQGIELNPATLAYLDGKQPWPQVEDLAGFDDFLAGADLAAEVDVTPILELLARRTWRPDDLLRELQRLFLATNAPRLRFASRPAGQVPDSVLAWCAEQCLRSASPLPGDFTREELRRLGGLLRPEWVSPKALHRLEKLGLEEAGVDQILTWLLSGQVAAPEQVEDSQSVVATAIELLHPTPATGPRQLGQVCARQYRDSRRFQRIAPQRWLQHLDALAKAPLAGLPDLTTALRQHEAAQWLLVDALGLPLFELATQLLHATLSEWSPAQISFAQRSTTNTTTDGCYRELLDANLVHEITKLDVVDTLLHAEATPFAELQALVSTRLAAPLQRVAGRLDPTRPLLVFADHGFRLSPNGRHYVHGGASTLERVVPLWHFAARTRQG